MIKAIPVSNRSEAELLCSMHGAKLAHFKQVSKLDLSILTKLGFTLENGIYSVCLN